MIKNLILLVVTGLFGLAATAQSFDVNVLPEKRSVDPVMVKYKNSYYTYELDMQGMSGFSANLKRFMHNIRLKKYNGWMEEETQLRVNAPDKNFGPLPPVLKIIHDKLYLLYFKNESKSPISLWLAAIDTSSLELSGHKEILQLDEDERYIQFYLRSVGVHQPRTLFFTESSADGSQYLVAWTSGWHNKLFFSVLDKDLNKVRTKTEVLPDETSLGISDAFIDNKGNPYFAWYYNKKGKGNAELMISKASGPQVKSITIDTGEPSGICAVMDPAKGKLLVGGAYKEESDNLKGVYAQYFSLDDMKAGNLSKTAFPDNLISILDSEGWANSKDKKKGLHDAIRFEAMLLDNNTLNLTGEFRRTVSGVKTSFDISGTLLNARFDNNNVAVFSRVPKVRVSAGSTIGDSYAVYNYKNKVIIFYNDHLSNLKLDMSATPKRSDVYTNSVLAAAIIDENGTVKREIVKDLSAEDYLGITSSMQVLAPGSYYIPFRRIKTLGGVTNDIKWALINYK